MSRNNRTKNTQKNKNKQNKVDQSISSMNNGLAGKDGVLTVPRSVSAVLPDRLRTTLRWWALNPINLSIQNTGSLRFQPSGAFDVDPNVGGATCKGFPELSALYRSYRVKSSTCEVELINPGVQTPVTVTLLPTNSDPSSNPSAAYVVASAQQPYAVSRTTSLRGGPNTRLVSSMSTKKIFGSPMTDYDDNFASLVNTVPLNNWFWVITFYSPSTIPSSEGAAICNVRMSIDIEFYDRAFLG